MTLREFVETYIPRQLQLSRDYTGPRGWVHLCNTVLRRLESERLIPATQLKETGVEVQDARWLTLPSDYRGGLRVLDPVYEGGGVEVTHRYTIVNGKAKLDDTVYADEEPEAFALTNGGTGSVEIDDAAAVENEYEGKLLVLQDGAGDGDGIMIGKHPAAAGGVTVLNFLHERATVAGSTSAYVTEMYVLLRYMAVFASVASSTSSVPLDARFSNVLANGLCYLAESVDSDARKQYRDEFEFDMGVLRNEIFTPTAEQARPKPRPMAGLECGDYPTRGFVGDENAWME